MSSATQDAQWIQKIMDVVHDGLIVLQDEDIVMANKVFSDMLDYQNKDVIDIAFEDIVDPQSRKRDSDLLEKLLSGEGTSRFSTRLVSKTGQTVHVEIKPTTVTFDGASAVLACVRNVSTQIALETTVTELENRFATLYDMSPVAYFMLSREGTIEQVNAAAEELLGCEAEEIIGKPISGYLPAPKPGYDPAAEIVKEVPFRIRESDRSVHKRYGPSKCAAGELREYAVLTNAAYKAFLFTRFPILLFHEMLLDHFAGTRF